jgi:hypothetical protein
LKSAEFIYLNSKLDKSKSGKKPAVRLVFLSRKSTMKLSRFYPSEISCFEVKFMKKEVAESSKVWTALCDTCDKPEASYRNQWEVSTIQARAQHVAPTVPHFVQPFLLLGTEQGDTWLCSTHLASSVNASICLICTLITYKDQTPDSLKFHVLHIGWLTYAFPFLLSSTPCAV